MLTQTRNFQARNIVAMEPTPGPAGADNTLVAASKLAALDFMVAVQPAAAGSYRPRLTRALLKMQDMQSHYASAGTEFGLVLDALGEEVVSSVFPSIHHVIKQCQAKELAYRIVGYENSIEIKKRSGHAWHTDPAAPFVGCVCRHKRYGYACVVVGWDAECKMSQEWQQQMGVGADLERGASQPFYSVRADDGSSRYAAFDSLEVCSLGKHGRVAASVSRSVEQIHRTHSNLRRFVERFDEERGAFTLSVPMQFRYPDDCTLHAPSSNQ